jgi:hypothetical protein
MLSAILSLAAPQIFTALGATTIPAFAASAIGGGIGKLLEGGDQQDALQAAALGGLGGFLGGKLAGGQNIAGGSMPGFATAGGEALPKSYFITVCCPIWPRSSSRFNAKSARGRYS